MSKQINTKRFRPLADEYAELQRQIDELEPAKKRQAEIRREFLAETKDRCNSYQSAVFHGESPTVAVVVSACAEKREVANPLHTFNTLVEHKNTAFAWSLVRFQTKDLVLALGSHDALRLLSDVSPGCRKVTVA